MKDTRFLDTGIVNDLFLEYAVGAKPFLKWAGGKGRLLAQLEQYYPNELKFGQIDTYIEPFLGGGAVFYDIIQHYQIKQAYLFDINPDLIYTYQIIQAYPEKLLSLLKDLQEEYNAKTMEERLAMFLSIRVDFNANKIDFNYDTSKSEGYVRAAQMIFLNKTCFNGLFRMNSKGGFNVPFGKYPNPKIYDPKNLVAVAKTLEKATLIHASFQSCLSYVDEKTFVYFDPPYRPLSTTSNFTAYSDTVFTDKEQQELAIIFSQANDRNAKLMLSNADTQDGFFESLYKGFCLNHVLAARAINAKGEGRGKISELLITNYTK